MKPKPFFSSNHLTWPVVVGFNCLILDDEVTFERDRIFLKVVDRFLKVEALEDRDEALER